MKLLPIHIEVLFFYYASDGPYPLPSKEHSDAASELRRHELLEEPDDLYKGGPHHQITSRGVAHVCQILRLPLPMKAWVDNQGALITT